MLNRRAFLKLLGIGAAASLVESCNYNKIPMLKPKPSPGLDFEPLAASTRDELVLPKGFNYRIIRSWGDSIGAAEQHKNNNGPKNKLFGFNNDFTCFFPLENPNEALLWVNHESIDTKYIPDEAEQRKSVGGSIIKIKRNADAEWIYNYADESQNRRIDANTPFEFTGPLKDHFKASELHGTLANCGGGRTPWGTVLTCEENYDDFKTKYKWKDFKSKHYGWVTEINPYDPNFKMRKHSLLGRFAHENAAITISRNGKVVIYMGDDKENEHIYKFVSARSFTKPHSKIKLNEYRDIATGFSNLLSEGQLYVARFYNPKTGETINPSEYQSRNNNSQAHSKHTNQAPQEIREDLTEGQGEWLPITRNDKRLAHKFKSDAEMLIQTRKAAKILGASQCDRPEDLEVSPHDGSIYVSLTRNLSRMNFFGSILRIIEDHDSLKFSYKHFVLGDADQGFACPDNLAFDGKGNLWVTTDAVTELMNPSQRAYYGNNGLYVIALEGPHAGVPRRFASAPNGAELTGPWFSEDDQTLFLSVQHPSGQWPKSTEHKYPRPSVISIRL